MRSAELRTSRASRSGCDVARPPSTDLSALSGTRSGSKYHSNRTIEPTSSRTIGANRPWSRSPDELFARVEDWALPPHGTGKLKTTDDFEYFVPVPAPLSRWMVLQFAPQGLEVAGSGAQAPESALVALVQSRSDQVEHWRIPPRNTEHPSPTGQAVPGSQRSARTPPIRSRGHQRQPSKARPHNG